MPRAPRIVLIMTDTQRYDMVGCCGATGLSTPSLDRLAGEGVVFERAYTCQPVCGPARSGLFLGTYPHSNGCWANTMAPNIISKSIGQRLHDQGVRTAYIGKWHLDGGDYFGMGRCPEGWDAAYWYDMRNYLEELPPESRPRTRRVETVAEPGLTAEMTFGHRVSNRAIDFLRHHGSDEFLLVVSYDEPHDPFLCPEPYASMYRDYEFPVSRNIADPLTDKPEHQRVWAGPVLREDRSRGVTIGRDLRRAAYFGCNSFVDAEIGRVLAAIDRHAPDALVIYTSDHGDLLESHRIRSKGPAMYDEITRIPFIVRWPGVAPAGVRCNAPISHIDVAPTILAARGMPVPKLLQGSSLVETFQRPRSRPHEAIFMEFARFEENQDGFGGFQPIRCAFDGRYKLVINLMTSDELYDLENDPEEMANLIGSPQHASRRDSLHDQLLVWMNETVDPFRGYYWQRRPWRSDAPAATWGHTGYNRQREHEEYEPRQLFYQTGLAVVEATTREINPELPGAAGTASA
jgi:uncharacterized sulfatase